MPMQSLIPQSWSNPWSRNASPEGMSRDPFSALHHEMNRLFESFGDFSPAHWPGGVTPRIDVMETENEINIEAELPGVDETDVDVTLAGDVVTIKGERKNGQEEKSKNYHLSERTYGSFTRSVTLPFEADPANVTAKFEKGVLHIAIPKPAEITAKTTKIPVKAA